MHYVIVIHNIQSAGVQIQHGILGGTRCQEEVAAQNHGTNISVIFTRLTGFVAVEMRLATVCTTGTVPIFCAFCCNACMVPLGDIIRCRDGVLTCSRSTLQAMISARFTTLSIFAPTCSLKFMSICGTLPRCCWCSHVMTSSRANKQS